MSEIEFLSDTKMSVDAQSENDLRIIIKAKYLTNFLDWFYSEKDRETSYNREFEEEVINTGILSNKFHSLNATKTKKIIGHVEFSDYHQCYELKPKDIICVQLNEEQKSEIISLMNTKDDRIIFANANEIKAQGVSIDHPSSCISEHAKFVL